MKVVSILSMVFILAACNESSQSTPALPDSGKKDGTAITKTPEVDTTADLLTSSVINNKAWEAKKANGVSWLGIGTEPFWSIERKKDSLVFQLSEWEKPLAVKAKRITNSKDSVVYAAVNDTSRLRVIIRPEKCSDGMSDRSYDYSLHVNFKNQSYKGCAVIF